MAISDICPEDWEQFLDDMTACVFDAQADLRDGHLDAARIHLAAALDALTELTLAAMITTIDESGEC
jgi:hypothetical protein